MDLKLGINNFRKTKDVQPSKTLILTLAGPEEEILARMHSKTRYNIRLAQKHGVKVSTSNDIEIFLFLLHQTTKRDKFKAHADEYYRHLLSLGPSFVKLYFAEYKNKILAANMMVFFGKTVTYLHGASSNQHRPVMAPHFLHWSIISQVKKDGYAYYDFWGISQKKWPSLTCFKKSFGGRVVDYPGTYDLVLDKKWYFLYKIGKFIKS